MPRRGPHELQRRSRQGGAARVALLHAIDRIEEPYRTMLRLAEICRVPRRALAGLVLGDCDVFVGPPELVFVVARPDGTEEIQRLALTALATRYLAEYLLRWRSTHRSGSGYLFPQPRHPEEPASLAVAKRLLNKAITGAGSVTDGSGGG